MIIGRNLPIELSVLKILKKRCTPTTSTTRLVVSVVRVKCAKMFEKRYKFQDAHLPFLTHE